MSLPKTGDVIDEILYGDGGPYVSAVPVLIACCLRDRFDRFVTRLLKIN